LLICTRVVTSLRRSPLASTRNRVSRRPILAGISAALAPEEGASCCARKESVAQPKNTNNAASARKHWKATILDFTQASLGPCESAGKGLLQAALLRVKWPAGTSPQKQRGFSALVSGLEGPKPIESPRLSN
jgi:hypothetical protein